MGNPSSKQFASLARQSEAQSRRAYDIGIPALQNQYGLINQALGQGGEPQYLKDAFQQQRVGLTEGELTKGRLQAAQGAARARTAMAGGNYSSAFNPAVAGSTLANTLYTSRLQEGMGRLDEMNKLYGMGIGQSQQAGSAALGAAGNALQATSMMPQYNSTYATVLGGANLAAAGYGAGQQAGWWGQPNPYTSATTPGGFAGSSNWQGFSDGMHP